MNNNKVFNLTIIISIVILASCIYYLRSYFQREDIYIPETPTVKLSEQYEYVTYSDHANIFEFLKPETWEVNFTDIVNPDSSSMVGTDVKEMKYTDITTDFGVTVHIWASKHDENKDSFEESIHTLDIPDNITPPWKYDYIAYETDKFIEIGELDGITLVREKYSSDYSLEKYLRVYKRIDDKLFSQLGLFGYDKPDSFTVFYKFNQPKDPTISIELIENKLLIADKLILSMRSNNEAEN